MVSNYKLINVGEHATPVIVIDDFLPDAQSMVDVIAQSHRFEKKTDDFYPGVRSHAPDAYVAHLHHALPALFADLNGALVDTSQPQLAMAQLSVANQHPSQLSPIQCIPHIDTQRDNEWALVHYLFCAPLGGTAFYRHKETGLERVCASQYHHYFSTLKRQATSVGLPAKAYINGDTAMFKQIACVEARFNRALLYPANLLHSGCLPDDIDQTASHGRHLDIKHARLTANASILFN